MLPRMDTIAPRLLIATGGVAADTDELPSLVREIIAKASEILVVTPILTPRLQWLANDTDRARFEADERLSAVLGHVQSIASDTTVAGHVGDEEQLNVFDDAIRLFAPNHILIALRAADSSGWQENHLTERVLERFHIPITVFELDRAGRVPDIG
jgi:hypothetical protein